MKRNCSKLLIFCIGSACAPATSFANYIGYNGAQALFTIERDDRGIERPPNRGHCALKDRSCKPMQLQPNAHQKSIPEFQETFKNSRL